MQERAIQDGDLIGRSSSVVGADISDETILIDVDSGYFFQLNKSAARIWALVEPPSSFEDLCAALLTQFEMTSETCRADVGEFVADMRARGLLKVSGV